jgi:hypothetical protein
VFVSSQESRRATNVASENRSRRCGENPP